MHLHFTITPDVGPCWRNCRANRHSRPVGKTQKTQKHLQAGQLHRLIRPVGILALNRHAQRAGRVEAQAIHLNILREFGHCTHKPWRGIRSTAHLPGRAISQIETRGSSSYIPATDTTHKRCAAVVVHEKQAELGVVPLRREDACGQAELAAIPSIKIGIAGDPKLPYGIAVRADGSWSHKRLMLIVTARATKISAIAAGREQVIVAEVGTARVNLGLLEIKLVETFQTHGVADFQRRPEHGHRQQTFFHLRTRGAQTGDVHRIGRIDAVGNEGALAPVHHLVAKTCVELVLTQIEAAKHIGIQQLHVVAQAIFGFRQQALGAGC